MLILILMESKVRATVNKSKNKKIPGHIRVINGRLKSPCKTKHYYKKMQSKEVPEKLNKKLDTILIPKKGD